MVSNTPISGEDAIRATKITVAIIRIIYMGWIKNVNIPAINPNPSIQLLPLVLEGAFLLSKLSSENPNASLKRALPNTLFFIEVARFILENISDTDVIIIETPVHRCVVGAASSHGAKAFIKYIAIVRNPKKNAKFP